MVMETELETSMYASQMSSRLLRTRCSPEALSLAILLGLPLMDNISSSQVNGHCFFHGLSRSIFHPGQALSGRYVIVQMDNGEGVPLNLREVMAFGEKGETLTGEVLC